MQLSVGGGGGGGRGSGGGSSAATTTEAHRLSTGWFKVLLKRFVQALHCTEQIQLNNLAVLCVAARLCQRV